MVLLITPGGHMPITAFNSFTDGLEPNRRSREHFVTNVDVADDRRWVPYADGVWFQPCHFNCTSGGFSVVLKGLPGAALGTHYHAQLRRSAWKSRPSRAFNGLARPHPSILGVVPAFNN